MLYRTSRSRALGETPCFAQVNASTGFIRRIKRELQQLIHLPDLLGHGPKWQQRDNLVRVNLKPAARRASPR